MAAIVDRHAFTVEFLEKGRFSKQHFTEVQILKTVKICMQTGKKIECSG